MTRTWPPAALAVAVTTSLGLLGTATAAAAPAPARASTPAATWHTAQEVPGLAALNQGGYSQINSMSCASVGNCAIGGHYTDADGNEQWFVASESLGTWSTTEEVPGFAALNKGKNAGVASLSCASAGNCLASGGYTAASGPTQ